jgi:flagellar basal-body rod protein FlgB
MPISDLPILAMLRTRMHWHQERQRILAENVSNADTPKFRPRDIVAPSFDRPPPAQVARAATIAAHLTGLWPAIPASPRAAKAATRRAPPATRPASRTR